MWTREKDVQWQDKIINRIFNANREYTYCVREDSCACVCVCVCVWGARVSLCVCGVCSKCGSQYQNVCPANLRLYCVCVYGCWPQCVLALWLTRIVACSLISLEAKLGKTIWLDSVLFVLISVFCVFALLFVSIREVCVCVCVRF